MIHHDFVNVVPMRLPPLNAIRAFEAVCRHGSILKAAEELNVVRGAVRQQIDTLENHFGNKLFLRDGRRLVPTLQASAFAAAASAAFDILQRAASELEGAVPRRIRIGVPSAFAVWWLMPRAADMQASLGDTVDIVPMATVEPLQMHPELDAVIIGGEYRPAAGITALRFMADEFGPVATPSLAATLSSDPAAMGALTMLISRSVPRLWDEWFAESGTPPVVFFPHPGIRGSAAGAGCRPFRAWHRTCPTCLDRGRSQARASGRALRLHLSAIGLQPLLPHAGYETAGLCGLVRLVASLRDTSLKGQIFCPFARITSIFATLLVR